MARKLVAAAAQARRTDSSGVIASSTVRRRKRRTLDQVRNEGYDCAVRNCVEALLNECNDREYVAWVCTLGDIVFPTTDDSAWEGLFAFPDWDAWVEAE